MFEKIPYEIYQPIGSQFLICTKKLKRHFRQLGTIELGWLLVDIKKLLHVLLCVVMISWCVLESTFLIEIYVYEYL